MRPPRGARSWRGHLPCLLPAIEVAPSAVRGGAKGAWQFCRRAAKDFRDSQGFVFASAIAYNALLSIIPFFLLLLVALVNIIDPDELRSTIRRNLQVIVPGNTDPVMAQIDAFLQNRAVIGAVGLMSMMFFSGIAFSVAERAMAVIFRHRTASRRRFIVSALLPYTFVLVLAAAMIGFTLIAAALDALGSPAGVRGAVLYALSLVGLTLTMAGLYLVLPFGRTAVRHALAGGVVATLLWEGVRRLLVWYFARYSTVNLVYGSIATTIVTLLGFEIGAVIVLVGAEVIAEIERSAARASTPK
jgi:membrane protein